MALDLNRGETAGNTSKGSDLDRYGVWVKKPPRTVENTSTPTEEEPQEPSPIDDLESAAREETSGIDALMDTVPTAPADGEDYLPPETFIDADFLDDFTNDISVLEEIQEEEPQAVVQPLPDFQEGEIAVEDLLDDSDEVPLEDFMVPDPQGGDDILDAPPIDMDLTFDDEFTLETEDENADHEDGEETSEAEVQMEVSDEKTTEIQEAYLDSLQVSDYTEPSLKSDDDFDAEKITSEAEYIGGNACGEEPTAGEAVQEHSDSDDAQTEKSQDDMIERPEEAMDFNQDGIEQPAGSRTEELISNIAREIALLRDEIANLKADFEAFKGGRSAAGSVAEPEIQEEASGGGFFADTEDDDTIALSGDELSNIFNTADFTEESVDAGDEEPDNGLPPMDFDSEKQEEPAIEDISLREENNNGLPEEIDVPTGATEQQKIFEEVELEENTEELFDDMFEGFDFEDEPFADEVNQTQEISSINETIETASTIDNEDVEAAPVSDQQESTQIIETFEEEVTDEPTEAVFESNQWEEPAAIMDSEEEASDTTAFDDDSLVIKEPVDTVSSAEEELLEKLAAEDVVKDGTEILQSETENIDFVEPVIEDIPTVESDLSDELESTLEMEANDEEEAIDELAVADNEAVAGDTTTEEDIQTDEADFVEPVIEELSIAEPDVSDELETTLEVEANNEAEAIDEPVVADELETTLEVEADNEAEAIDEPVVEDATEEETNLQADESHLVEPVVEELSIDEPDVADETETAVEPEADVPETAGSTAEVDTQVAGEVSESMKNDIKAVLSYMDKLLDSLPEEKIAEFARSEHFELYKKLFTELGLS